MKNCRYSKLLQLHIGKLRNNPFSLISKFKTSTFRSTWSSFLFQRSFYIMLQGGKVRIPLSSKIVKIQTPLEVSNNFFPVIIPIMILEIKVFACTDLFFRHFIQL